MLLIPAIDLKNGQCVRLRQGKMDDVTVFSDDPVAVAKRWADEGAQRLHVVDLDGALKGQPLNLKRDRENRGGGQNPGTGRRRHPRRGNRTTLS